LASSSGCLSKSETLEVPGRSALWLTGGLGMAKVRSVLHLKRLLKLLCPVRCFILAMWLACPLHATARSGPSPPPSAAPVAPLDLPSLIQRLRETHAIGLFTKLSLKNQVDDLLAEFRAFYQGGSQFTLAQLRQDYEVLLLKVVSLLQDDDPSLANEISSSREAIWSVLSNPKKFATI
jgi:hypothetical protein